MRASDDSAHRSRDGEDKKRSGLFASIARGFKSLTRISGHSGRYSDNATDRYKAKDSPPNNDNVHFRPRENSYDSYPRESTEVISTASKDHRCPSPTYASEASLASDNASGSHLLSGTPVRHQSCVIAHRAAVMRARTRSQDAVGPIDEVGVAARIEAGQVVTVTSDEHALQQAIVAAGMMWPRGPSGGLWTRKLGISGTIAEVDMSDGTVALSGDHGWIPINALAGFELWQRGTLEASNSNRPAACSNEISPAAASTGTPLSSPQPAGVDAAPSRSSRKGRFVTNISESSEDAQPHIDPEVTPEARVSDPAADPARDRKGLRTDARKKSKIKRSVCRTSNGSLGSRARHSGRSSTSLESPASRLRTRGSFFDDMDDLTSDQENEQASCQATSRASAGSSSPPSSLNDAVQATGLRRISGLSLLADDEPSGAAAQVTQQPRPLSGEPPASQLRPSGEAARMGDSRCDKLQDLVVQNCPSLGSEVTSNGPAETLQSAVDTQGNENGQQPWQAVAVEEVSENATRQPKARTSKQRLSQASNSPVDASGDSALEDLEKAKRKSESLGDGKASPPKQRSSRVKRSGRPMRGGSLASVGSQTFLEDDLLVPAIDPSKQQEADDIERVQSMIDLMLNESSDDSMAGDIRVIETRPTPNEDTTDELQGKRLDSQSMRSTGSLDSRCSIFSSVADSPEASQACLGFNLASSREGAAPGETQLLDVPGARISSAPEASTRTSLFKRFSISSFTSGRFSQTASQSRSRHINWRHSRVGSLCESNLLDEAMAKVAVGEQAMHPERAKSGFSLFKRMKILLEAQDFDDTPGQKVIENIFFDSIPKKFVEICSIEQVLRVDLLKRFLKKVSDESGSIEATFHGTREEYVKDILDVGLCPNLCATGAYGRGAYVGTHAGVAHQYADPNAEGWRHMCVVLVVVGQKVVKGKEGEQCPATALDSLANPTQYCFVDDDRLYISHLITYRVVNTTTRRTGGGWDDPFQRRLTTAVSRAAKMRNKGGRR